MNEELKPGESFGYARNEEGPFTDGFTTREAAVDEGFQELERATIVTQICRRSTHQAHFPGADHVIEYMQDRAYDEGGEYGEDYLDDVTDEAKVDLDKRLLDLLNDWITVHQLQAPRYFDVSRAVEVHTRKVANAS